MSRYGQKQEDQLNYRCSKLEAQNKELLQQVKKDQSMNNILMKTLIALLNRSGGTVELSDLETNVTGAIDVKRNEDLYTTTLTIKQMEVEADVGDEG